MNTIGKYLALDLGKKKTGIAISDQTLSLSRALKTISTSQLERDIREICQRENIIGVVIGLPLGRDGKENDQCAWVKEIGDALSMALNLPVHYHDEKLTSWEARERLKDQGYKPAKIEELEDQIAAQIILEEFLRQRVTPENS